MDKWDWRMMDVAKWNVASWSKDPSEGVGALLVSPDFRQVSWGFNGFPRGIEDTEERLNDKETKLKLTIHAELNALNNAVVDVTGWTLYCTKFPCSNCAKSIIQKGIKRLVCPAIRGDSSWILDQTLALNLLKEARLDVTTFSLTTMA